MTRTVRAYVCAVLCDCILLAAALPLAHFSLSVAHSAHANRALLLALLGANFLLLGVCLIGLGAWCYALFQSFRATHASVVNDAIAIRRKTTVSSSTTPAN